MTEITWRDVTEVLPLDDGTEITVRTIGGNALFPDGLVHWRCYDVPLDATDQVLAVIREWIVNDLEQERKAVAAA